jgi:hypothetical protein
MIVEPLSVQEMAAHDGANVRVRITHEDLTEATANTAQTLEVYEPAAKHLVKLVKMELKTAFEDQSDAAFNTTAITVGDAGSANRYLTSTELNKNGTEIFGSVGTGTALVYTAAGSLNVVFNAMAAKSLVDIDKGELWLYFHIVDTSIKA